MEKRTNMALQNVVDNSESIDRPAVPSPQHHASTSSFLLELQSTLELEELLVIFFRHLNEVVECQCMEYHHPELEVEHRQGQPARHGARYRLTVGGEELGTMRFSRRRPFSGEELERLEEMLSALMLPVRNAIHYRRALQAAYADPLTGLRNRRSYHDNLERELSRARREGQALGLMVIDIDRFKQINDRLGHLAGDQVLVQMARLLRDHVRKSDLVFRLGGDEFVLLLPNIRPEGLQILEQRIRDALAAEPCRHDGRPLAVTLSMGSALLEEGMDGQQLFQAADQAMYQAKSASRARH